jgi:predicted PurR-regulated permease PerM
VYYAARTVEKVVPTAQKALQGQGEPENLWGRVRAGVKSIPVELRVQIEQSLEQLPATIKLHLKEISTSVLKGVGAVVQALLGAVVASFRFVLFFVVTAYLLVDLPSLREGVKDLLPVRHKAGILRVLAEIDRHVHAFFRGQFVVSLVLCGIYSVGLLICGVDFAVLIGVAGGLSDMVPYLGLVVGMMPALLFASVPYTGLARPLGVVIVFVFGQTFAGLFLSPRIVGKNVGLSPVVIILAIMVFGQLLGFLGILFAVPLAAAAKVLLGELVRYYKEVQKPSQA